MNVPNNLEALQVNRSQAIGKQINKNTLLDERTIAILRLHFDPINGSLFWLKRQEKLGFDVRDRLRTFADLDLLGRVDSQDLRNYSVFEWLPKIFFPERSSLILGESAGTSGKPHITLYREREFYQAFIIPFLEIAQKCGFPRQSPWLWIGPSGPHIIGKVVRVLAREMASPDPFSVDFDPRWVKKLKLGSYSFQRYLDHVVDQALTILERENIEILFTTPPIVTRLTQRLSNRQLGQIRGIHYGGMVISAHQMNEFKACFPNAIHLSGYGNTLFGVLMESEDKLRTHIDYTVPDSRLLFRVENRTDENRGQICFTRLDQSVFLNQVMERDHATIWVNESADLVEENQIGWYSQGAILRDPAPPIQLKSELKLGLY